MSTDDVEESPSQKSASTRSSGFKRIALFRNGILNDFQSAEASDKEEIVKLLNEPRPSSPPPLDKEKWTKWAAGHRIARNEEEIKMSMKGLLVNWLFEQPTVDANSYFTQWDVSLDTIPSDVPLISLSAPKLDAVEGFLMVSFKESIDDINGAICTDDEYSLALPHLLMEFKGPEDSMSAGKSQCAYNAAILVYGHNEAMKFLQKYVANDQKAVVFSMATNGVTTQIYGHFSMTRDDRINYHQCHLMTLPSLTNNYDEFKKACTIIHNLQYLGRQRSQALRDMLHAAESAAETTASESPSPQRPKRSPSNSSSSPAKRARVH